jgi:hypothetical protein
MRWNVYIYRKNKGDSDSHVAQVPGISHGENAYVRWLASKHFKVPQDLILTIPTPSGDRRKATVTLREGRKDPKRSRTRRARKHPAIRTSRGRTRRDPSSRLRAHKAVLSSQSASDIPGDTLRVLTRAAIDTKGKRWPAGTLYRPISLGYDNESNHLTQTVNIGGRKTRFKRRD